MKWHRRWRGKEEAETSGGAKANKADKGSRAEEEGETTGGTGRWKGLDRWDALVWNLLWCCVQWWRSCKYNQRLEASRKEGSNGKVFEEEVGTGGGFIPRTPLSFSGFPSLDAAAAAAAALSASSPGPYASISGFWFGQTKKRQQQIFEIESEGFCLIWGLLTKSRLTANVLSWVH